MFQKGNQWGRGRPKISLSKPELLLPAVFAKAGVNWANDFTRLYKAMRERELDPLEQKRLKLLMELLPYLCTKVQLKEIDNKAISTAADSSAMAKSTAKLLQALEQEHNAPKSESAGD